MKTFVKIGKTFALLFLIDHYSCISSQARNPAFFGLSDEKECKFFMKKLEVSREELVEIVDLLFKKEFVRFAQLGNTFFVFLTNKGSDFVFNNQIFGSTFSAKN
jgi:hypothetical protein